MFKIDPNTLYAKKDLAESMAEMANVDRFLERIRPKSAIMGLYLGSDLLSAIRAAPDYRELKYKSRLEKEGARKRESAKRSSKPKSPEEIETISLDEVSA
jgi:hypothetical protein